jgi:alanine-glyoxylate transaminase/serine-glyoxylate transaminase/serine-pyruvate transaminase
MSPMTFSLRAVDFIKNRKFPVLSWFSDLNLLSSYWNGPGKRAYHHTAPSNQFYGLHEALLLLKDEGIENSWQRHNENSSFLVSQLKEIGLEPLVPEGERIPNLLTIKIPNGIDEAKVRSDLLNNHNLEIGAGLGELSGKVWRIGLMGYNSNSKTIDYLINALKDVLR